MPQLLQIALGRQIPTRAARHRLHNNRRHIRRVVQRQDTLLQLGQRIVLPHRQFMVQIGMGLRIVNKAQVVHPWQHLRTKRLAVAANAAHAHAAKANPVVAALTPNKYRAVPLATRPVIGQREFERGIGGL